MTPVPLAADFFAEQGLALVGSLLGIIDTMKDYGVAIIGVKPKDGPFRHVTQDIVIQADDLLVVAGCNESCEAFAALD